MDIRSKDDHVRIVHEILGRDFAITGHIQVQCFVMVGKELHADALQVQDDIRDIFLDTRNRRHFLVDAFDFHGDDCRTLQGGKKHSTEGVTERDAPASFESFDNKLGLATVFARFHFLEATRHLK